VWQRLRQQANRRVPMRVLKARDTMSRKGLGFAAGADDVLLKPFTSEEPLWRCQALARPNDWHLHLRDGSVLARATWHSCRRL
jgi:DNA-binding response OmpR family regulator